MSSSTTNPKKKIKRRKHYDKKLISKLQQYPSNTVLKGDISSGTKKFDKLIPDPQENIYEFIQSSRELQIPESFNGRQVWADYLTDVVNQNQCGSCWAFSAVSCLADRFNLHSLGKAKIQLSPVPIVLCNTHGKKVAEPLKDLESSVKMFESVQKLFGCNGDLLSEAWRMLFTVGTNTTSCMPLSLLKPLTPSSCIKLTGPAGDMCYDYSYNYKTNIEYGTPAKFYSASHVYSIPGIPEDGGSELDIQRDIFHFGPVSSAFELYADFYDFDPITEVYECSFEGERISGHAIVIDGWGIHNGVKFWWVRNSWGKEWGVNGYFRFLRGSNHCKIEENVIAGFPDLKSVHYEVSDSIEVSNVAHDIKTKFFVHSYEAMAGGIDAEKGYSRRVLSYMKYDKELDKQRIPTPDYKHFIAGNLGREKEVTTTNYFSFIQNPRAMAMSLPPQSSSPPPVAPEPPSLSAENEPKTERHRRRIVVISVCVGLIFLILWKLYKTIPLKR